MHRVADALIDALGGTTAVSKLTDAPLSTVHSWRKNGIPRSRLSHLRLAVRANRIDIDFDRLANGATPTPIEPTKAAA
jgi:predicted RNA polymerase sigma factor